MGKFKIGDLVTYTLINGHIVHGKVLEKSRGGPYTSISEAHTGWDIEFEYSIFTIANLRTCVSRVR